MTAQIQVRRDTAAAWTSANPVLKAGELGYETDTGNYKMGDGAAVWTALGYNAQPTMATYTPVWTQNLSDIDPTVNYAKYTVENKIVSGSIKLTAVNAGTAGYEILVTTPVAASVSGLIVGTGWFLDKSTGDQYKVVAYLSTANAFAFVQTGTQTSTGIGVDPNLAVAANDVINFKFEYEAA